MMGSKSFRTGTRICLPLLLLALAGCVRPVGAPESSPRPTTSTEASAAPRPAAAAAERRFEIAPADSLLTVAVRRGGPLARLGHNHVIAMRDLRGQLRSGADLASATFEWTQPVERMTVDEASLRAEAGADFSAPVPEEARAGTRSNMLGQALLDAARFPELKVSGRVLRLTAPDAAQLAVEVLLRGQVTRLELPVRFAWRDAATLEVDGELELRQTQLGLAPFSVMMGALQVEDLMHLRFRLVARATVETSR